jgi:hypothetical protein
MEQMPETRAAAMFESMPTSTDRVRGVISGEPFPDVFFRHESTLLRVIRKIICIIGKPSLSAVNIRSGSGSGNRSERR